MASKAERRDRPDDGWRQACEGVRRALEVLASCLTPFPTLAGPGSLEAVEVDPPWEAGPDAPCVVVCPDGRLYTLTLRAIPGPLDVGGVDTVHELEELEVSPREYLAYAGAAVAILARLAASHGDQ